MQFRAAKLSPTAVVVSYLLLGCSSEDGAGPEGRETDATGASQTATDSFAGQESPPNETIEVPLEEPAPVVTITETLPASFTATSGGGGYRRLGLLEELTDPNGDECANILRGIVRDFEHSHADFGEPKQPGDALGMVGPVGAALGDDRKPVRVPEVHPNVSSAFGDWYNNTPAENVPHVVDLWLEPQGNKFVFDSTRFFPLDEVGTLSGNDDDGVPRNFGFTTELHTAFMYQGGERFAFRGDDDVFVYIDSKLVLDLGGIHNPANGEVNLDTLGLTPGQVYSLDLFHAERNPTGSNFRIETTLDFSECGEILATDIIR